MKILYLLIALLISSLTVSAQNASLRGTVTDESGAIVPGAKVSLSGPENYLKSVTAGSDGTYSFTGLKPGNYSVQASAPDLAAQAVPVVLKGGAQVQGLQMKVASVTQQVTVQESAGPTVSTEPANNASALILKGEDLQALPDDPDDLQDDLQALAGPAAGPNGGQMYIDGFSNGQLPPKDSIREIRINQNPFSPEFDKLGYGRIEIFTKPGTDKFHGQGFFNLGDDVWNSRNPYAQQKAPFLLQEYGGTISGPINKRASFFLDMERRAVDNGAVIDAITVDPNTLGIVNPFTQTYNVAQRRFNITPRVDYQLNSNNTLTLRYGIMHNDIPDAGIGNFTLVDAGYKNLQQSNTLQMIETAVLNTSTINETRFQWYRTTTQQIANTETPAVDVLGAFNGGGSTLGNSLEHDNYYELQNYTSIAKGVHNWKFGVRMRGYTVDSVSPNNFLGSFTFGGGMAPELDANNQPILGTDGSEVLVPIQPLERYQRGLMLQQMGYSQSQIAALGGGPTQYSVATGTPTVTAGQVDAGLFVGDDWRLKPNLTVSLGLRYETQTNIHDWHDFAPRIGIAWGLGGAAHGRPKTVLRAGFGMFYDRFPVANTVTALRYNGISQQQYILTNPDFFLTAPPISSLSGFASKPEIQEVSSQLQAPYLIQSALTLERQLPKNTTVAVTYTNSHGVHQLMSEDINAPLPGTFIVGQPTSGVYPYPNEGPILLATSSGLYNQNQVVVNFNSRMNQNVSLFGHYMWNHAMSNTDGLGTFPANPYNFAGQYGPASTDIHNRLFFGGSINSKWNIRVSPFIILQSGAPFDITAGQDLYGDTLFNARPGIATDPNKPGVVQTPYGLLDPNPTSGEQIIPRNFGRGPGMVSVNVRLGKTWGFGPEREGTSGVNMGGGHGPGGFHGMFDSGMTNRRYNLTTSISARNLLNHNNPGPIIGNITSPLFGQANQIAGGGGGLLETANNRRLELQIRFTF